MYIIEWLDDLEILGSELSEAATVSAAIAQAMVNSGEVAARVGRQPNRFRIKDQGMRELAVVALPRPQ